MLAAPGQHGRILLLEEFFQFLQEENRELEGCEGLAWHLAAPCHAGPDPAHRLLAVLPSSIVVPKAPWCQLVSCFPSWWVF